MNQIKMLDRLVSLRNNALNRSDDRYREMNDLERYSVKAMLLEQGINQLIMEIQTNILAENQQRVNVHYEIPPSSKAC